MHTVGIIERAFELARSGELTEVNQIRNRLRAEGYSNVLGHLQGRSISNQLRSLIKSATNRHNLG